MDVPIGPAFDAFSVPATVTPPGADAIETRGFWVSPTTIDAPTSANIVRRDMHLQFVLRRADVPNVPKGTFIDAPPYGSDTVQRWRVDGFDRVEGEFITVLVIDASEAVIPRSWIDFGWVD